MYSDNDVDMVRLHRVSVTVNGVHSESVSSPVQQSAHVVPVVFTLDVRLTPLPRTTGLVLCKGKWYKII